MKEMPHKKKEDDILVISSDLNELKKIEKFCSKISKKLSFGENKSHNLTIIVTELVNNAILHGNKSMKEKSVTLKATYHSDRLVVSVKDEGNGFDPSRLKDPTNPENLWNEGGRGIFLVKELSDKVEIKSSPRGTEIIITKYYN